MSQMSSLSHTTTAMQGQVERARQDIANMRNQVAQYSQTDPGAEPAAHANTVRTMMKRVTNAEQMLAKAETAIRRVKSSGRGAVRAAAAPRDSERAKRALAVLLAAPHAGSPGADAGSVARRHLSAVPALRDRAPLRDDQLKALYKRASQQSKLGIGPVRGDGVGFLCEHVFRAFMWFRPIDPPAPSHPTASPAQPPAVRDIEPEWISVFGIEESASVRWSASKYAVFAVLTERANAAVRYFWARERSGADAFVALARWLALHRTVFSDACEDRRLAFDASRGIFLPPCVRSFDGTGGPRFTRGSIPVRSTSSSYARSANGTASQQAKGSAAAASASAQGNGTTAKMET